MTGLDFLNCCLQFDPKNRMSWNELTNHTYIKDDFFGKKESGSSSDQLNEQDENMMFLSFTDEIGYVSDKSLKDQGNNSNLL